MRIHDSDGRCRSLAGAQPTAFDRPRQAVGSSRGRSPASRSKLNGATLSTPCCDTASNLHSILERLSISGSNGAMHGLAARLQVTVHRMTVNKLFICCDITAHDERFFNEQAQQGAVRRRRTPGTPRHWIHWHRRWAPASACRCRPTAVGAAADPPAGAPAGRDCGRKACHYTGKSNCASSRVTWRGTPLEHSLDVL